MMLVGGMGGGVVGWRNYAAQWLYIHQLTSILVLTQCRMRQLLDRPFLFLFLVPVVHEEMMLDDRKEQEEMTPSDRVQGGKMP